MGDADFSSRWQGHGFPADLLTALLAAGVPQRFLRTLIGTYSSPQEWREASLLDREDPAWRLLAPTDLSGLNKQSTAVLGDGSYPWIFALLPHPPVVLYVEGDPSGLGPCVSVTGSRLVGELARSVTSVVASALAGIGAVLATGGEAGVEEQALREMIDRGGRTLLVPACSPDAAGARLADLRRDVLSSGGAVLSQFPPGTRESSYTARARRRLLVAVAYPLVVADAALPSAATTLAGEAVAAGSPLLVPVPPARFRADASSQGLSALLAGDAGALGWGDAPRPGVDGFANGAPENGDELREMLGIFWALRPRGPEDLRRRPSPG